MKDKKYAFHLSNLYGRKKLSISQLQKVKGRITQQAIPNRNIIIMCMGLICQNIS